MLVAHNRTESFGQQLAQTYQQNLHEQIEVKRLFLKTMQFDPILNNDYQGNQELEEDLIDFQQAIKWADHLVIFAPVWWGGLPAKLKGLFDRSFLPHFAFKYEKGKRYPTPLLTGKSADLILTMDTPPWYYRFIQGNTAIKQLKQLTLQFAGFKSIDYQLVGPMIHSNDKQRQKWIKSIAKMSLKHS